MYHSYIRQFQVVIALKYSVRRIVNQSTHFLIPYALCALRHALIRRKDLDATEDQPPQLRAECH
jgi:hypothetical protein